MKKNIITFIFIFLVTFLRAQSTEKFTAFSSVDTVKQFAQNSLMIDSKTINSLFALDAAQTPGIKQFGPQAIFNAKRFWITNFRLGHKLEWKVFVADAGKYHVEFLVKCKPGAQIKLKSLQNEFLFTAEENGWQRTLSKEMIHLKKGLNTISLQLINDQDTIDIKGIDLTNSTERKNIEKRIAAFKGDASWMKEAGYGIMTQVGGWAYPPKGDKKVWPGFAEDFDVPAFVDKVRDMGGKYIVWSATWSDFLFPAPIKAIEEILPKRVSKRDLLGEIIRECKKYGIRVMMYYHMGHEWKDVLLAKGWIDSASQTHASRKAWLERETKIFKEIGLRYGKGLDAVFLDDGVVWYPADFEKLGMALKTGNPQRLITYNPWVGPNLTPFQDFYCGEGFDGKDTPYKISDGCILEGPQKGLQLFGNFIFDGPEWGVNKPDLVVRKPLYWTADKVVEMTKRLQKERYSVAINLLMYEDGTIGEESYKMLKQAAQKLNRGKWSNQSGKRMDEMWGDVRVNGDSLRLNAKWFRNAKYAMFIHWGLFSQNANRWKGRTFYGIGEWLMYLAKTRIDEYEKIAGDFNPVNFNAKEWVQLAKDAGMKYIVITAKHHDGFAMFKSAHPYNIVDGTPFKRDPMKELAEACEEAGIKLGFYYSQFQDWHEINAWSPDLKKISFEEYFNNKCKPQVTELLENYGPLTLVWFDTPGEMTRAQSQEIVDLVKEHQPEALINSRIGNGVGDYSTYGDHEIPSRNISGLWEAVNTSNDSWGYAWYDENWKGPFEIASSLVQVVARGGNFMLNVGPRADGTIPEINASFLRQSGDWVKAHSKAIYGAESSPWLNELPWGDITMSGNQLYLFVFNWQPGEELWLPGLKTKILSATIGSSKEQLAFKQDNDSWAHIQLPIRQKKELIEVITLELEATPEVNAQAIGVDPVSITAVRSDFARTSGARKGKSSWMEKFGEWKHKTNVGRWSADTSSASWTINVKRPGKYFVNIDYHAWTEADGGEWDLIAEGGDTLRIFTTETTGSSIEKSNAPEPIDRPRQRFKNVRMGVIEFKRGGVQNLKFAAASKPKSGGIDMHAVYLSPVK